MVFQKGHKINNKRIFTKEHRLKLSISGKGKHNYPFKGDKNFLKKWQEKNGSWLKGKTYEEVYGREKAEEIKNKQRNQIKKKKEKNPNWNNGSSFEPYTTDFDKDLKEKIRQKYHFICQLCSKNQKVLKRKLAIHHIDYNKKNCEENNLIPLCISCNLKVNKNRNYWKDYFSAKFK